MNGLDIAILLLVLLLAAFGYAQGFIVGVASLGGILLGGIVGTRAAQYVLERAGTGSSASEWAPVLGLLLGILITAVGAMAMQDVGLAVRRAVGGGEAGGAVDQLLGAVLLAGVALLLAWFTAAAAIGVPQLRQLRPQLTGSSVLAGLNASLPDAGPLLGAISSYDPFPAFDGGRIDAAPPDASLPSDPQVRLAARSVVRVVGTACGFQVTGSGWVVAPGYVATNAHVVAGQQDTRVQPRSGGSRSATVVAFDAVNDLALLRVRDLPLRSLELARDAPVGTPAVVLGFPEGSGLTTTPARLANERRVRAKDIYGARSVQRSVTSFRGVVRHGNSGGPIVDPDGRVLGTVFASTVGERVRGGYGVPNSLLTGALRGARAVPAGFGVRTGRCVS